MKTQWSKTDAAASATVLVEQRAPLPLRILGITVVVVLAVVLVVWGIDLGRRVAGVSTANPLQQQLTQAESELASLTAERDELRAKLAASEQKAAATTPGVTKELPVDLAALEKTLPAPGPASGLVIHGLQAHMAAPGSLQYTILLSYGAKAGSPAFDGHLHWHVTVQQDGKTSVLNFSTSDGGRAAIEPGQNQRASGTLDLPAGAVALAAKASMIKTGKVVASEATTIK